VADIAGLGDVLPGLDGELGEPGDDLAAVRRREGGLGIAITKLRPLIAARRRATNSLGFQDQVSKSLLSLQTKEPVAPAAVLARFPAARL
jgi:hypothetical protein